jgi:hypothetical protein
VLQPQARPMPLFPRVSDVKTSDGDYPKRQQRTTVLGTHNTNRGIFLSKHQSSPNASER